MGEGGLTGEFDERDSENDMDLTEPGVSSVGKGGQVGWASYARGLAAQEHANLEKTVPVAGCGGPCTNYTGQASRFVTCTSCIATAGSLR